MKKNNKPAPMLPEVLSAYGLQHTQCSVKPFGTGLINNTWKIDYNNKEFILQRINDSIFKNAASIAKNMELIGSYLLQHHPEYLFVHPMQTTEGAAMLHLKDHGFFRLMPFVAGSHTIDVVNTPAQAFEAASQFARFTKLLGGFDAKLLHTTLPGFHDLSLRYRQFRAAADLPDSERKRKASRLIDFLAGQQSIADKYEHILHSPQFKLRVTHHDTKISNVLFDDDDNGLCVIDLDTVMPGYFISDVGDMMRTYLSPVSEEEEDLSKIEIRDEYFAEIVSGYASAMGSELTQEEKKHFVYAGKFMIYMQALRFLTDYLNNDVYYGQKYEGHNFVRASNQCELLHQLTLKEQHLSALIKTATLQKLP